MDTEKTIAVFRRWPNREGGGVIALFPEIPASDSGSMCSSYEHVGQHGAADYQAVIALTVPAMPSEYASLRAELQSKPYGYNLDIRARVSRGTHDARRLEAARAYGSNRRATRCTRPASGGARKPRTV